MNNKSGDLVSMLSLDLVLQRLSLLCSVLSCVSDARFKEGILKTVRSDQRGVVGIHSPIIPTRYELDFLNCYSSSCMISIIVIPSPKAHLNKAKQK